MIWASASLSTGEEGILDCVVISRGVNECMWHTHRGCHILAVRVQVRVGVATETIKTTRNWPPLAPPIKILPGGVWQVSGRWRNASRTVQMKNFAVPFSPLFPSAIHFWLLVIDTDAATTKSNGRSSGRESSEGSRRFVDDTTRPNEQWSRDH